MNLYLRLSYNGYYTRLPSQGRGFDSHQPLKYKELFVDNSSQRSGSSDKQIIRFEDIGITALYMALGTDRLSHQFLKLE